MSRARNDIETGQSWNDTEIQGAQVAAPALGIKLQSVDVRSSNELTAAFATATKEQAEALMVPARITDRYEKQSSLTRIS